MHETVWRDWEFVEISINIVISPPCIHVHVGGCVFGGCVIFISAGFRGYVLILD